MRKLGSMMHDLRLWRERYLQLAATNDSPALSRKCHERADSLDDAWHSMQDALMTLSWMS